jgi:PAS domain S-box-containing protein
MLTLAPSFLFLLLAGIAVTGALFSIRARQPREARMPPTPKPPPPVAGDDPGAATIREYLDAIADGIIVADRAGRLTHWNPAALRLHGYTDLEEVRCPVADFRDTFVFRHIDGQIVPFEQWPMSKMLHGETVRGYELEVSRLDTGQSWTIAYSGSIIPGQNGGEDQIVLTLQDVSEQRRAERELRQSHIHLSELLESLPQLVWIGNGEHGGCDYASPQYIAYTGVAPEKLLGSGWLEQVHPDDRQRVFDLWKQAFPGASTFDSEVRIRGKDGTYRWFQSRAVPLRDAAGRVMKWFGTNTDIHEQKIAAESKSVLAAIVEHSYDAIIGKSLQGEITSWNQAAERMFGYRAEEVLGKHCSMLLPQDCVEQASEMINRLTSGETIQSIELQGLAKDGTLIDASLTVSPIRDAGGTTVGISMIVRDISDRNRDARALRESEKRFRDLAAAVPQIVWNTDAQGVTVYRNERWRQFSGLQNAAPADVAKMIHPDDAVQVRTTWARALATGIGFELEFRMRPATGGPYRWFLARAAPMRDASGAITEWFGTSTDIDDLKQAEALARERQSELAHLERMRTMGQMAAGLAHELNQPLGAVANYAGACRRLLEDGRLPPERLAATLESIESEALRAGAIIRRLRTFVRKQAPQAAPVDPNAIVEDAMELLTFELRHAQIEPQLVLPAGLPPVLADSVQIEQVLVNLVRNALEAMETVEPASRALTIETAADGDGHIRFSVRDRGAGVASDAMDRIFDAFFTTKPGGLGIGLALCRTIIEDHGGQLTATPAAAGGMEFVFTLRCAENWKR